MTQVAGTSTAWRLLWAVLAMCSGASCMDDDLNNDQGSTLDASAREAGALDTSMPNIPPRDANVVSPCKSWTMPAEGRCGGAHCLQTFDQLKASASPQAACAGDVNLQTLCSLRGPNEITTCAVANITDRTKVKPCAEAALGSSVSGACLDCYVKSADCAFERCLLDCAAGSMTELCDRCRLNMGCADEFFACAGLAPPPTE
jgi:hypothetical protein